MPLLIPEQRTEEWRAARAGKITASVAAAVLGVHPEHGPYWAYQEIMGQHAHSEGSAWAQWGTDMEAHARAAYEIKTGNLTEPTGFWVHPAMPWLGSSPDGLIGSAGVLEIKCLKVRPEVVPDHYLVQMRIHLIVTDREWCDFFCWHPEWTFSARVWRDDAAEIIMIAQLDQWYHAHVLAKVPPPRRKRVAKDLGPACDSITSAQASAIVGNMSSSNPTENPLGIARTKGD